MKYLFHQTPNTKHQTPNTKHQTPNTKHQTPIAIALYRRHTSHSTSKAIYI
ncbi:hypothetical protein [Xanthomarina sp. GH4-25]|uniref:hypothetical protein n=1 Tax=Xanthomarina sp. GH4-25 TaxID=3349335 RepID=UPI0038780836